MGLELVIPESVLNSDALPTERAHYFLLITVIQLLFATAVFCDLPMIKWFMSTHFCDQDYSKQIQEMSENWFMVKSVRDYDVLANLAKVSHG